MGLWVRGLGVGVLGRSVLGLTQGSRVEIA